MICAVKPVNVAWRSRNLRSAYVTSMRWKRTVRRESINELIERWRDGDVKAAAVVDKAIEAMVSAIASAINICDVDTVMLGGVWSQFGPEIASHMQGMMRRQVLGYPEVRAKVLMADVTSKPALIGSAAIGLRRFIDNPMRFVSTD